MDKELILEKTLSTDLAEVMPLAELIAQKVFSLTGSTEEMFKVKLALEEALNNAMRHGNKLSIGLSVTVKVKADKERIILDVHDQGKGFDFDGLKDPTHEENRELVSGRGVFLMRQMMDGVKFYDSGRGVRMVKVFKA